MHFSGLFLTISLELIALSLEWGLIRELALINALFYFLFEIISRNKRNKFLLSLSKVIS